MFTKLRNSYHNASVWAHHHTAVLVFGLTVLAAAFGWQFGSHFMGELKTHASGLDTWCQDNSETLTVSLQECDALVDLYVSAEGQNWSYRGTPWFSNTDIQSWQGLSIQFNNIVGLYLPAITTQNTITIQGFPFLKSFHINNSTLGGLTIPYTTELTELGIFGVVGIDDIDLSMMPNLDYLSVGGYGYNQDGIFEGGVDMSGLQNLRSLSLTNQAITSLDVSNNLLLESVSVNRNRTVENIHLPATTTLQNIQAYGNKLAGPRDLSSYTNLQYINLSQNKITEIIFPSTQSMRSIDIEDNRLTSIDLSPIQNKTQLNVLKLQNNLITDLGVGFDQFTNIGWMYPDGEFDYAMNGNCLNPQTLSASYISFLDSKFANWEANQTCGRDVPESEYNALVDLYNATDGDNWIRNDGWLSDYSVCDWQHVSCVDVNGQQHVRDLWLNNNNLQGSIPASLGDLTYLEVASFDNWIEDNGIPLDPNVVDVHLSVFAGMNYLKNIGLFYAQGEVTGTLNDLGLLPALEHIRLDGTKISGTIPSFFSQMTNLKTLDFEGSSLEGTIPDLTTLVRLEVIDLRDTNVSGPLPEFATQHPAGTTPALVEIKLNGTMLDGELPASWGSLTNLQEIAVGGKGGARRYISGELPESWGNLQNLTELQIMFTNIEGSLPASWGNLIGLERLNLVFNRITGEFPSTWENLAPQNLLIMANHLEGQIPAWITNAQNYLIQNNCLDIDNVDPALEAVLDQSAERGNMWRVQNNCLSDVVVTKTLSNLNPLPGEQFTLTIGYKNFGPQKAPRFMVSEVIDDDIELITSVPPEAQAIVNKEFGVDGDICYDNMYSEGTGPYAQYFADFLASILGQTDGDGQGLPEGMTTQEFFDMTFYSIILGVEDQSGIDLEQREQEIQEALTTYRDLWDEPTLGTPGVMSAVICDFIQTMGANIQNPVLLKTAYDQIGEVCLPSLGFDYRAHEDQCGAGGEDGYKWDIGDLVVDEEDEIVLNLRLKPGLSIGSTHDAITYLVLDGANLSDSTIPVTVTAGGTTPPPTGPVCGNNIKEAGEQCDGGPNCNVNCTNKVVNPVNPGPGPTITHPTPLVVDDCSDYVPPVDQSSSYYDADCEPSEKQPQEEKPQEHKAPFDKDDVLPTTEEILAELAKLPDGMDVDAERVEAYLMAKKIGMTTMPDFVAFQPGSEITRAAAAKYFVQYVETVLEKKPDESRRAMCSTFDDIDGLKGQDLYEFVIRACMHKLMGLNQGVSVLQSFRPYDTLPRAEGAAMVSRLLYGTTYDNTHNQYATRYEGHITKLLADKIISDPNPDLIEKRVYPLLMFLRWIKAE